MDWHNHIKVDPDICHGKPCVSGTRVMVTTILDNLAEGIEKPEIIKNYPSVTEQDINAVMKYAADLANERVVAFS
ncbi:MAG: DUF433 domain-containing protein [Leptospirales bacterium]